VDGKTTGLKEKAREYCGRELSTKDNAIPEGYLSHVMHTTN